MRIFILIILLTMLFGCETVNLSKTIAGGACGYVDYSVTIAGAPILGIKADRECGVDEAQSDSGEDPDNDD